MRILGLPSSISSLTSNYEESICLKDAHVRWKFASAKHKRRWIVYNCGRKLPSYAQDYPAGEEGERKCLT